MDITIERKSFLDAFDLVAGVAPAKSPKAILQNVKLVAGPDGCHVEATDLEVSVRHGLGGVEVRKPGRVVLPKHRVRQVLATSADATLDLKLDKDRTLKLVGDRAQFSFATGDPDEFPSFPEPDPARVAARLVVAADLRKLIRRTIYATDTETARYALGGCLVEFEGDVVALVATDGRRLAKAWAPATEGDDPAGVAPPAAPVIPVKALKLIDRAFAADSAVRLALGETFAVASGDRVTVHARLVEGRFPRYRDIFPASSERSVTLPAGALLHAVGQAAIATSDDTRGIDLTFGPGELSLAAQAADVGSSRVTMPLLAAETEGRAPLTIVFDARYLLDLLKSLDPLDVLVAEMTDAMSAPVFRCEGATAVVMPLTRDR